MATDISSKHAIKNSKNVLGGGGVCDLCTTFPHFLSSIFMSSPNVLKINEELKEACSTCFCTFQHFVIRYAKTTFSFYQEFVLLCSDWSHRSSDALMCLSEVILLVGN